MTDEKCKNPALFRYTWPGRDESMCCLEHTVAIQRISEAIGLHLQMIQVDQRKYLDTHEGIALCQSADDIPKEKVDDVQP